jgi:hypothetical protein
LPDPEPPATPITSGFGTEDTWVAYIRAVPILAGRLLIGNQRIENITGRSAYGGKV